MITSKRSLALKYNEHLASSYLISQCITPEDAAELLERGAVFNELVLVDGEGEELLPKIGDVRNWDDETMPYIRRLSLGSDEDEDVRKIHQLIEEANRAADMG